MLVALVAIQDNSWLRAQSQPLSSTNGAASAAQFVPVEGPDARIWGVELKRQFTDRSTPEASSRTTLRLEVAPYEYLSLIRLDIPFVDRENGAPFTGQLGDIKNKLVSRSLSLDDVRLNGVFETTFPSARPESLGRGKYQLGPGFELVFALLSPASDEAPPWTVSLKPWLEQNFSVAGNPAFNDINYTKLELELKAEWKKQLTLKLTPKPVYDWKQSDSGAVMELESDWNFTRRWCLELVLGHRLWGTGVPATYRSKIEMSLRFNF